MKRAVIGVLAWCMTALAAAAAPDITGVPEHVVFLGPTAPVRVSAGHSSKVALEFRVSPTFHINSNTPKSELLIPTQLLLSPPSDTAIGQIRYPPGVDANFAFAPTETLSVYAGRFVITAVVSAARTAVPGKYRVHGTLKYQACDNRACYPPRQLPVEFDVNIQKSSLSAPRPSKPKGTHPQ
ncbi:MAG: disulfide bond formation protein DsbC [Acidobacteriia bacterium]|nr:disulfide bond formation protein DsbC [Terriglobia bacterium]